MAIRIHVVASRNVAESAFRSAFPLLEGIEIREESGWLWFTVSVWSVSRKELLDCVGTFDGPSRILTTADASLWTLHLQIRGNEPFRACHRFSWLRRRNQWGEDAAGRFDNQREAETGDPFEDKGGPGFAFDDDFFEQDEDLLPNEMAEEEAPFSFGQLLDEFGDWGFPIPREIKEPFSPTRTLTDRTADPGRTPVLQTVSATPTNRPS